MEASKQASLMSLGLLHGAQNRGVENRVDLGEQGENTQHSCLISHSMHTRTIRLRYFKFFTKQAIVTKKNALQMFHNWFLKNILPELKDVGHPQGLPAHLSLCLRQGSPPALLHRVLLWQRYTAFPRGTGQFQAHLGCPEFNPNKGKPAVPRYISCRWTCLFHHG